MCKTIIGASITMFNNNKVEVDTPNELLMPVCTICWTPRCKTVRDVLLHCCVDVFLMGSPFVVDAFLVCCTVVAADPGRRGVPRRRRRCTS
jgi:hypothetical protein